VTNGLFVTNVIFFGPDAKKFFIGSRHRFRPPKDRHGVHAAAEGADPVVPSREEGPDPERDEEDQPEEEDEA
jgi:hypothetical protein